MIVSIFHFLGGGIYSCVCYFTQLERDTECAGMCRGSPAYGSISLMMANMPPSSVASILELGQF